MLRHNRHTKAIQNVAIQISPAYTKGVSNRSGNTRVVYDRSDVIQNVVQASDPVRKAEYRACAGKRYRLEVTRWMRLKNRVHWKET